MSLLLALTRGLLCAAGKGEQHEHSAKQSQSSRYIAAGFIPMGVHTRMSSFRTALLRRYYSLYHLRVVWQALFGAAKARVLSKYRAAEARTRYIHGQKSAGVYTRAGTEGPQ